ncbi:1154_t:CDS:2 [Dentiscutata erythropus]|uniref:1154_t:CDS:1 n=1 Tax=Dentiscutata erythropus TaxID=1348616 RepID=A0A9N9GIF7_9GLOM|nr:1154_t:CDS:2 [Dentiscutata erythropus]
MSDIIEVMIYCLVLGDAINASFSVRGGSDMNVSELKIFIKDLLKPRFDAFAANQLKLWQVDIPTNDIDLDDKVNADNIEKELKGVLLSSPFQTVGDYFKHLPSSKNIRIIVKAPDKINPENYNRDRPPLNEQEFWEELTAAQIVFKLPVNFDETTFMSAELSEYINVQGNEAILNDRVMLNAQDELINNNGEPIMVKSTKIKMNYVKFLRLRKPPTGVVYGISTQEILIRKSYLQMIEKIEYDRAHEYKEGCVIIGSPGIGKTHFSLYLAFYISRRYHFSDIVYHQSFRDQSRALHIKSDKSVMRIINLEREFPLEGFYIADSVILAPYKTAFTFLVTIPKRHEFTKEYVRKYYAPIWTEEEIWDVWNVLYKTKILESRVKELIRRWGCIPRRIFCEYNDEPNVNDIVSQCDAYAYLKCNGGALGDNYSGKAIHIIPNSDFTDKTYVPASTEICEALFRHYKDYTKEIIIKVIRNFVRGAGGTLARRFFELMAHDVLSNGGTFTVRRLTKDGIKQPEEVFYLQNLQLKQFRNISEITPGYYNIPEDANFESVDAIAPQCNGIHHLQQQKHMISNKLENHLKNLPIHLYFVVPDIGDTFNNFYLQKYVTAGNTEYSGWQLKHTEWIKNRADLHLPLDLQSALNTGAWST